MEVVAQSGFVPAVAASEWYKNLNRRGSCLTLYDLLVQNPQLLRSTCSDGVTAVQMAVVSGSPKMVLLLKWAIDTSSRVEKWRLAAEQVPGGQESTEGFFDVKKISYDGIRSRFLREKGIPVEADVRNTNVTEDAPSELPVVPVVTDEGTDESYDRETDERVWKVYAIIEGVSRDENPRAYKEEIEMLKDECRRDVDFEFSPVAQVFLHFLCSIVGFSELVGPGKEDELCKEIIGQFIEACNRCDHVEEGGGGMLKTLFNLHYAQGRTILHAAFENVFNVLNKF